MSICLLLLRQDMHTKLELKTFKESNGEGQIRQKNQLNFFKIRFERILVFIGFLASHKGNNR